MEELKNEIISLMDDLTEEEKQRVIDYVETLRKQQNS